MIPVSGLGVNARSKPPVRPSQAHPTMTNLERRLEKLEALRADSSGLVPHSQAWFAHLYKQLDLYIAGELHGVLFPIEIISGWIAQANFDEEEAR